MAGIKNKKNCVGLSWPFGAWNQIDRTLHCLSQRPIAWAGIEPFLNKEVQVHCVDVTVVVQVGSAAPVVQIVAIRVEPVGGESCKVVEINYA